MFVLPCLTWVMGLNTPPALSRVCLLYLGFDDTKCRSAEVEAVYHHMKEHLSSKQYVRLGRRWPNFSTAVHILEYHQSLLHAGPMVRDVSDVRARSHTIPSVSTGDSLTGVYVLLVTE